MVFGYHQGTCRPHRTWNMFTLIGNALLNWWKVENNSTRKTEFICMRNPIKNEAGQKKEECSHTRLEGNKKKRKFERAALMRFRCRVASDGAPTWTPASLPSIDDENRSKCIDTETFHRGLGAGRFCCDVSTDVHWLSPKRWAQDGARKDCFAGSPIVHE